MVRHRPTDTWQKGRIGLPDDPVHATKPHLVQGGRFPAASAKDQAIADAVVNISIGGAPGTSIGFQAAASEWVRPEMTSLNMGSLKSESFALSRKSRHSAFFEERKISGRSGQTFHLLED